MLSKHKNKYAPNIKLCNVYVFILYILYGKINMPTTLGIFGMYILHEQIDFLSFFFSLRILLYFLWTSTWMLSKRKNKYAQNIKICNFDVFPLYILYGKK